MTGSSDAPLMKHQHAQEIDGLLEDFGGTRRVLVLVDRANLGEQAVKEFQSCRRPDACCLT